MPSQVDKCSVPASVVLLMVHLSLRVQGPLFALLPLSWRITLGAHHTQISFTYRNRAELCFGALLQGGGADTEESQLLGS